MQMQTQIEKQAQIRQAMLQKLRSEKDTARIKLGVCFRELKFNRDAIDEDARTVALSFSSEDPYERWFGYEILGHDASEVRLGRLNDGAPLLFNHDRDSHLGIIEDVKLENKRGYSVVRFGNGALANEKFQDVKDGILQKVSVGYIVHKAVLVEENKDGPDTYRMTDWEPMENSLVTIPADNSVGVGRSAKFMDALQREFEAFETTVDVSMRQAAAPEAKPTPKTQPHIEVLTVEKTELTPEERRAAEKIYGDAEAARIREIVAIGEQHGALYPAIRAAVKDAIKDPAVTAGAFAAKALDMISSADPLDLKPATSLDLTGKQVQTYSLMRAISAQLTGNWSKAGFERECSDHIAGLVGRDAHGFFVPFDIQSRALTAGGAATGAELVGTDHLAGSFIDTLRPNSVVAGLNATILPGLVGNVSIPRLTSNATFAWVAEDAASGDNDPATGALTLSPKILAGGVPMSRTLLKQSSPSVEQMITNNLAKGAALGLDLGALAGSGATNNPTGITTTSGVATSTIASAGSPTWAELVEFETDVDAADGLMGTLAYVTTAAVKGNLKTTAKDAGSGRFLCEDNMANGYPLLTSSQLAANRIIFGNFEEVIMAMWGVLDVRADEATKATSGGLVLRAFLDADIGVKHAGSFCINV